MACSSCDGGLVWSGDAVRACECVRAQRRQARSERLSRQRRERGRRGGIKSGVRRRELARGKRAAPRPSNRDTALALRYPIAQLDADEFETAYRRMCEREGIAFDRRGMNTALELYRTEMTAYRAQGQHFETTNGQRSRALELRGRRRERRTVQRTRKRLEAMGLVSYAHIRRGRVVAGAWQAGEKADTLRVELRNGCHRRRRRANDTPPYGKGEGAFGPVLPPPSDGCAAARQRSRPPSAVECAPSGQMTSAPSAPGGTEEGGRPESPALAGVSELMTPPLEAELAFQRSKLAAGFRSAARRIAQLEAQLAGGAGQETAATCSSTMAGFK